MSPDQTVRAQLPASAGEDDSLLRSATGPGEGADAFGAVDPIEMLEPVEGLKLVMRPEPADLRTKLRDGALAAETRDGASYEGCFTAWLWEHWRSALEPKGMSREAFADVVTGYRRELWFWLMGDRRWAPLISGLAGRVARRLPSA